MLVLALIAAAAGADIQARPTAPTVRQTTATVRIISGERIRFHREEPGQDDEPKWPPHPRHLRMLDGGSQPAWLVEFP